MNEHNPGKSVPRSTTELIFEITAAAILLIFILYLLSAWSEIPERVPGHFGASGEPDRWDDKSVLISLPIVALFLYGLLTVITFIPRKYHNQERFPPERSIARWKNVRLMLSTIKAELMLVFAYIGFRAIEIAEGTRDGLGGAFLPVFLILLFGTITYFLLRLKRL